MLLSHIPPSETSMIQTILGQSKAAIVTDRQELSYGTQYCANCADGLSKEKHPTSRNYVRAPLHFNSFSSGDRRRLRTIKPTHLGGGGERADHRHMHRHRGATTVAHHYLCSIFSSDLVSRQHPSPKPYCITHFVHFPSAKGQITGTRPHPLLWTGNEWSRMETNGHSAQLSGQNNNPTLNNF
jgi:hypothetical protein